MRHRASLFHQGCRDPPDTVGLLAAVLIYRQGCCSKKLNHFWAIYETVTVLKIFINDWLLNPICTKEHYY